jgi:hypothetical protein
VDAQDVRVLELRRGGDLAPKALNAERDAEIRVQDFERNASAVLRVPGQIDCGHPAATELPLQRVLRADCVLQLLEHPLI